MPPPQLPRQEPLQGGVGLIDEGPPARLAKVQRPLEVVGLLVVEDVALAVVGGGAAGRLVAERGATLDGQSLVGVDESLADGEGDAGRT